MELPAGTVGGLLSSLELYPFFDRDINIPDLDLNKAVKPGWYRVDGASFKNVPTGKYNYGLLVVLGNVKPYRRMIQFYITDNYEFCFRRSYGGSAGKEEIDDQWLVVQTNSI